MRQLGLRWQGRPSVPAIVNGKLCCPAKGQLKAPTLRKHAVSSCTQRYQNWPMAIGLACPLMPLLS
jgi:hypothetical protein